MSDGTRCGTIALAGLPNAGKSTLLNALVGEPLAIVSAKPQTTRLPVIGIRTEGDTQLIFVDPPGLLDPTYLLQERMLDEAQRALRRADAILHLHPAGADTPPALRDLVPESIQWHADVLVVRSKADLAADPRSAGADALMVSAHTGDGLDGLLAWCRAQAPHGPFRHDPEDVGTQPVRFFVAEYVREAAFDLLGQELPYSIAAEVDEFREGSNPLYIRVTLYVERASQKGMVVGKDGQTVKTIGSRARSRIETFLAQRVYLDLWVKTLPKWRTTPGALRRLGFTTSNARP